MTDDPTTKVCPGCNGKGTPDQDEWCCNFAHIDVGWGDGPCPDPSYGGCGGTGRVEMDTGELLEALHRSLQWPRGFDLSPTESGFEIEFWTFEDDGFQYDRPYRPFEGQSPDDALRAALREVTE